MRSTHVRRRHAALVAAVALVTVGCGVSGSTDLADVRSGTSAPDATDSTSTVVLGERSFEGTGGAVFLRDAAKATGEVRSQKVAMAMTMAGVPGVGDVTIRYDGAFDDEKDLGTLSMDMGDLLGSLGSSGSDPDLGRIEMILDGDTVYLKSSLFSMLGDGEKTWLKAEAGDLTEDGSGLGTSMQTDPGAFLDFLQGSGDELETVGREDVRGEPTTHLRTELDIERLLEDTPAEERAELEEQLEGLGGSGAAVPTIPAEVWVDDDGYVRKFQMDFDFAGATGDEVELGDVQMRMVVEMYDFNEPVSITVPDPADVGELDADLFGGN